MGHSLLQVHSEVLICAGPLSEQLESLQQDNLGISATMRAELYCWDGFLHGPGQVQQQEPQAQDLTTDSSCLTPVRLGWPLAEALTTCSLVLKLLCNVAAAALTLGLMAGTSPDLMRAGCCVRVSRAPSTAT